MRVIFQFFMHISDIRICMSFYWNIMYLTLYPFWKKYFSILLQCQHLRGKVLATMSLKCIVYPSAKSGVTCNKDKYCLDLMNAEISTFFQTHTSSTLPLDLIKQLTHGYILKKCHILESVK